MAKTREYHKKAMELMESDMRAILKTLYTEEGYKAKSKEITDNLNTEPNMEAGRTYYETITVQSSTTVAYVEPSHSSFAIISELHIL